MKELDVYPIEAPLPETAGERVLSTGGAMVQTRSAFNTAIRVQQPRQLEEIKRRLEAEAMVAGEDFYYGWGAGKDRIEGASKELAFAAARCYGNCAVDALPIQETPESWIFTAAFIDLETGFTMTRQFRQSKKWTVFGKLDSERKDDIRFQIGQSKAARNVILNSMPATLINAAMEKAKSGVRQKLESFIKQEGIHKAIDIVLKSLARLGVKAEHICEKFSIQDAKALTVENLIVLKGDYQAIESGQEAASTLFPSMAPAATEVGAAATESNADKLRAKIGAAKKTAAQDEPKEEAKNAPAAKT